MKINQTDNYFVVLKKFGNRIKGYRVSSNITQSQLAHRCGLSVSTLIRIENGEDTKWSAILRILSELNLLNNLDILIPEIQPSYKAMFENKPTRKRVRHKKKDINSSTWTWGEDKGDDET